MTSIGSVVSTTDVDPWTREKDYWLAIGLKGGAFPDYTPSGAAWTSQQIYGAAVYLYADEVVTNVVCCVNTAGAGTAPTALKLGLWSSAATPVCLAATADLAADARWTSQGWKVNALTSPYTVLASGLHYLSAWVNGAFGTTPMQTLVGNSFGFFGSSIGSSRQRYGPLKTGATTMAVSDTGTYAIGGTIPWMGWS